ncbi:MAG: oligosaccharide flippase family protein [Deltaproteobacteria bacterium]|nr:oligosaccharide flippase family protein [Deltaproteobacteria bacterium]
MSRIRKNILANFFGRGWAVISAVAFLPLYVSLLGVEAYGLVGVFTSLQVMLAVTDMGLSATLTREVARLSSVEDSASDIRDTVRTMEVWYFGVAALIIGLVMVLAPLIANHWVKAQAISAGAIETALRLMGLAFALQAAFTFYQGALVGLQQQVYLNGIYVTMGLFRALGTIATLALLSSTIEMFALWQVVSNVLQLIWIRTAVWRVLPASTARSRYRPAILRHLWRYSASMLGMTVTSSILLQTDKVILSRMLPLDTFGYYTLAWTVAQTPISALSSPVYQAVFPRLTQHVARGDTLELSSFYHRASQTVAVLVLPFAAFICLFSRECLLLWLGNSVTAANTYPLVRLLVVATGFTGVLVLPYALTLAHGWASLSLKTNVVNVVLMIPLLIALTHYFGPPGACGSLVVLNAMYLTVFVSILHRYTLVGEQLRWYLRDLGLPLAAAATPLALFRQVFPAALSRPVLFLALGAVWVLATLSAVAAAPDVRRAALGVLRADWRQAIRSLTPRERQG